MATVTQTTFTDPITGTVTPMVLIDNGDGTFTSMSQATYEATQAQTPTDTPASASVTGTAAGVVTPPTN